MEVPRSLTDALDAIRADPDDTQRYLVLGDLLSDLGDPRGELIAVQVQLRTAPADRREALQRREKALMKQHREHLLGGGGIVALAHPTWVNGYVRAAKTPPSVSALVTLLGHPSATFLQELTLQTPFLPLPDLIDAVARSRHPMLEAVTVNSFDRDQQQLGPIDITELVQALPRLRALDIAADEVMLRKADSGLADLYLVTRTPSLGLLNWIAQGHWPKLRSLSLDHFTERQVRPAAPPKQELFRGFATPSLESLAIRNIPLDVGWIAQLAESALLRRLRVLDLAHTGLDETTLAPILAAPSCIAHLERFDLAGARLDPEQRAELAR